MTIHTENTRQWKHRMLIIHTIPFLTECMYERGFSRLQARNAAHLVVLKTLNTPGWSKTWH